MKRVFWVVPVVLVFLVVAFLDGQSATKDQPKAEKGVLDLAAWDFDRDGPIRLEGEWEVLWEALETPGKDDGLKSASFTYTHLPAPWSKSKPGAYFFDATGAATLRLVIKRCPTAEQLALRLTNVFSSWALWENGRKIGQSGIPALKVEDEIPRMSSMVVPLQAGRNTSDSSSLELVLQVSNHHYREGGVISSIRLGPASVMQAQEVSDVGVAMFFAGCLFIMVIYHVVLYLFRRRDLSPLILAMFSLLWFICYCCTYFSDWVILAIFPNAPALRLEHLGFICFFLSLPVGCAFIRSLYPRECSVRVEGVFWALGGAFAVLDILSSPKIITTALPLFYITAAVLIIYYFMCLYKAWRKGREGAFFILMGFIAIGLIAVNDILNVLRFIPSRPLMILGVLIFILSQAFALSQRLMHAFSAVETLSVQLENKNLSLEEEMIERNRLEREVINISEEERRRISADLHDGICQLLTAARLRCSELVRISRSNGAAEGNSPEGKELTKLSGLLDVLVDKAYEISHGLWPQEHDPKNVGSFFSDMVWQLSRSSGIPISFTQNLACETCPPDANVTQLCRIAQEALTNAAKHSGATDICLDFFCTSQGMMTTTVRDNGEGRPPAAKAKGGLGMRIMAHRARMIEGELRIEDAEGGGTVVSCSAACGLNRNASQPESNS